MNAVRLPFCDVDFGHRDPMHTQFMPLFDGDSRVSWAEQQDYMPAAGKASRLDSVWFVVALCLSPLVAIAVGSLIAGWR